MFYIIYNIFLIRRKYYVTINIWSYCGGGNIYSSPTTQLDDELSSTSTNAVQNKVISDALDEKAGLKDNNIFSGDNTFGYVTIDDNGLSIHGDKRNILMTDVVSGRLFYHNSELVTKDDIKNAGSSSSIDEQSLIVLTCSGVFASATQTSKSDWVIKDTTAYYVYDQDDVTPSSKAVACDLDNFKLLKTVCGNGSITIYYPNTNIPDDGVQLTVKYI